MDDRVVIVQDNLKSFLEPISMAETSRKNSVGYREFWVMVKGFLCPQNRIIKFS